MLSCKEISKLVSESLDRKFSPWQRVSLWMHIGMCGLCRRFRKDVLDIHAQSRQYAREVEDDVKDSDVKLSDESRERMKRALQEHDS